MATSDSLGSGLLTGIARVSSAEIVGETSSVSFWSCGEGIAVVGSSGAGIALVGSADGCGGAGVALVLTPRSLRSPR